MPAGRPTAYKPEYCQLLLEHFDREPYTEKEVRIEKRDGTVEYRREKEANPLPTLASFAVKIKVNQGTLYDWARKNAEFAESIKDALDNQQRILVENGLSNLYAQPMTIFALKNLANWKDKQDIELTGKDGGPIVNIDASNLSDEQIRALSSIGRDAE